MILVVACLALPARAAASEETEYEHGVGDTSDTVDISALQEQETEQPAGEDGAGPQPASTGGGDVSTGPWPQYKYVINCMNNGPNNPDDVLCGAAVNTCERPALRFREYVRMVDAQLQPVSGPAGQWRFTRSVCRGPNDATGVVPPQVTTEMVMDAAEALAPESTVHVEPAAETYVNVPTNFWTEPGGDTVTVTVLGNSIAVTFTPTSHVWDFGDGNTAEGNGIEGASVNQAGAVEHPYAAGGEYEVTLTTHFVASFTLPDGSSHELDGISTTSDPYVLPVGEIQHPVVDVG